MHVGHLRSTIIGDCISNILQFLGNKIIRINHIGDWGTQFGILIAWIKKNQLEKKIKNLKLLEYIYIKSYKKFLNDKNFANYCRKYVVLLQNKDNYVYNLWKKIVNITIKENQKIYSYLKINLKKKNIIGESFYQNMLLNIVNDLLKKKIAIINKKSKVIFFDEYKDPLIIQKADGAYLYSTTEIASIKYRYEKFKINEIIYFTDFRQKQHLKQIFYIVKKAKYIPKYVKLKHLYFGIILNKKGKPLKTRKGLNFKLKNLIKLSKIKSLKLIKIKQKKIYKKKKLERIAKKISIGAIKYAELSKNRKKNYIFNWNKIISFNGNTGPYLQYAYTRIISILRNNKTNITKSIKYKNIIYEKKIEFIILKNLLNFDEIIKITSKKGKPHILCDYLYNIASLFSNYYEKNNIKIIKKFLIKKSKLKLISIIAKTIRIGLNLLGIPILYEM